MKEFGHKVKRSNRLQGEIMLMSKVAVAVVGAFIFFSAGSASAKTQVGDAIVSLLGPYKARFCIAALIGERLAVTSGHCLLWRGKARGSLFVKSSNGQVTRVTAWALPPDYFKNDISDDVGIIWLAEPIGKNRSLKLDFSATSDGLMNFAIVRGGKTTLLRSKAKIFKSYCNEDRIQASFRTRGGDSGAPVLKRTSAGMRVVGIYRGELCSGKNRSIAAYIGKGGHRHTRQWLMKHYSLANKTTRPSHGVTGRLIP